MTELGEFGMWAAIGGALIATIVGVIRPIGLALARRISGPGTPDPATGLTTGEMTAERVAALEERINEMEAERAGLEERLEFAERMLSSGQAEQRSMGPGGPA
jgi:hypothetical protein